MEVKVLAGEVIMAATPTSNPMVETAVATPATVVPMVEALEVKEASNSHTKEGTLIVAVETAVAAMALAVALAASSKLMKVASGAAGETLQVIKSLAEVQAGMEEE